MADQEARHIIRTWRGGLSDESNRGLPGAFKVGYNLDLRKDQDTLSCTQSLVKQSASVVVDLPMAMVVCSNGYVYAFGDAGKIYRSVDTGTTWTLLATDADGAIKGAAEWNGKIYWATNTKLKSTPVATINFAAPTTVSSLLTAATYHTMKVVLGALFIANGSDLAQVNYAGTFGLQSVRVPPDQIIKALDEKSGFVVMGTYRIDNKNEGSLFLWDTVSLNYNQRIQLPGKGVNVIITSEYPLAHVGDSLHYTDMQTVVPLYNLDASNCDPYGVENYGNVAYFGLYGNTYPGIYSYGRKKKNMMPVLNLEHTISPATVTQIGSICFTGSTLLVGWKSGATYGIDKLSATAKATAVYQSLEWHYPANFMDQPIMSKMKVVMRPLPASCTVGLAYRMDNATSFTNAVLADGSGATTYGVTGGTECYFQCGEAFKIYELQLTLTPSANTTPEILRVESYLL